MPADHFDDKNQPTIHRREGHGFAPLPEEGGAYRAPNDNSRGPLVLMLAIVVMLVFGVVVWNAYRQGVRNSDQQVLTQIASEGAFKSRPDNPGGRADQNVDMEVMHQGGREADEDFTAAKVREEPVPLGAEIENVALDGPEDMAGLQSKSGPSKPSSAGKSSERILGRNGEPVDLENMMGDLDPSPAPSPAPRQTMAAIDTARTAPKPKATQTSQSSYLDAAKPTPKPTRTTAPIPEPTKIAAAPIVAAGGNFVVQLAAVQDKSAIDTEWKKASTKAPDLFLYAQKSVQTVDLGAKGVWHRIQAGGFESRDLANAFCASFKERGGDCIVKAK